MEVIALTPRGYCHGVVHAIGVLKRLAYDDTVKHPIYVLGMVVHNQKIVNDFTDLGITTLHNPNKTRLDLLDEVDSGTVVFTAHGVSNQVIQKAKDKGLDVVDTTCKDVTVSQNTVLEYLDNDFDVLFIGKHNHPESETVLTYGNRVHLITSSLDVDALQIDSQKIALTNQTTMSLFDVYKLTEKILNKYPQTEVIEELCAATKTRQLAVMQQDQSIDFCFVVGDPHSNNSNKLVSVSKENGINASLIEGVEDLDIEHLKTLKKVSVTSGASTPTQITKEVISFLSSFDKNKPETHDTTSDVNKKNLFTTKW